MEPPLSDPEKALITELAVGIARKCELFMRMMGDFNNPAGFLFHQFSKPHRRGCELLVSLGAAKETYQNKQHYYRIASEADIRSTVPVAQPDESVLRYFDGRHPRCFFGRLLQTYIELACAHGTTETALPATRKAFVAQPEYTCEVEALARCGYLKTDGSRVQWTKKIAGAMRANSLWEEDGRSRIDTHHAEYASVATAFLDAVRTKDWRSAPKQVTLNVTSVGTIFVEFFKRIGDKDKLMSLTVEELAEKARTSTENQFVTYLHGTISFSSPDALKTIELLRATEPVFAAVHRTLRDLSSAES